MKQKYFIGTLTMALLGISSDLTISGVNGVATKSQAQLKAKTSSTLKALVESASKVDLSAKSKSESKSSA